MNNQKNLKITVVGGDLRQVHVAECLARACYTVATLCMERDVYVRGNVTIAQDAREVLSQSDVIILPLPVSTDNETVNAPFSDHRLTLRDLLRYAKPNALILGGMVGENLRILAQQQKFEVVDYLQREELAVLNAVPTVEGALAIAMQELPITIFGSTCVVTGFGRIAKVLARLLPVMGARTLVAARKHSDLAWAKIFGCEGIPISKLKDYAAQTDLLFNTVPAMILDESILGALKKDCLVIDLASKPGGVDFDMAKNLGIQTIWALSLPGKVAPFTAGAIIKDTVIHIMTERGVLT